MKITNSTKDDLQDIMGLYEMATNFQKIKFPDNIWPQFESNLIKLEIEEKRQWKIIIDDEIACIWATTFSDPNIWEEKNNDPSIYIHRIATNPRFRGQQFVIKIVDWAKAYASQHQKEYIRMDTCGKNNPLIKYYSSCGFDFLGIRKLKNPDGLPLHYIDADVCFFQIKL